MAKKHRKYKGISESLQKFIRVNEINDQSIPVRMTMLIVANIIHAGSLHMCDALHEVTDRCHGCLNVCVHCEKVDESDKFNQHLALCPHCGALCEADCAQVVVVTQQGFRGRPVDARDGLLLLSRHLLAEHTTPNQQANSADDARDPRDDAVEATPFLIFRRHGLSSFRVI